MSHYCGDSASPHTTALAAPSRSVRVGCTERASGGGACSAITPGRRRTDTACESCRPHTQRTAHEVRSSGVRIQVATRAKFEGAQYDKREMRLVVATSSTQRALMTRTLPPVPPRAASGMDLKTLAETHGDVEVRPVHILVMVIVLCHLIAIFLWVHVNLGARKSPPSSARCTPVLTGAQRTTRRTPCTRSCANSWGRRPSRRARDARGATARRTTRAARGTTRRTKGAARARGDSPRCARRAQRAATR